MKIDVTYTFSCCVNGCDVTDVDHRSDVSSYRLPMPREPQGWTEVGVLLFCPRHTILLHVDGEAVAVPPVGVEPEDAA